MFYLVVVMSSLGSAYMRYVC